MRFVLVDDVFTLGSYSAMLQNSYEELDDDMYDLFETPTKVVSQTGRRGGVRWRLYQQ